MVYFESIEPTKKCMGILSEKNRGQGDIEERGETERNQCWSQLEIYPKEWIGCRQIEIIWSYCVLSNVCVFMMLCRSNVWMSSALFALIRQDRMFKLRDVHHDQLAFLLSDIAICLTTINVHCLQCMLIFVIVMLDLWMRSVINWILTLLDCK